LTLAQAIAQPQGTNRRRQVQMSMAIAVNRHDLGHGRSRCNFGLFLIKRSVAAPAEIVGGTELNEQTAVTSDDFPGIDRRESRGHLGFGSARAGLLRGTVGDTAPDYSVNLG
jgi:hypothetical protein